MSIGIPLMQALHLELHGQTVTMKALGSDKLHTVVFKGFHQDDHGDTWAVISYPNDLYCCYLVHYSRSVEIMPTTDEASR